MDLAVVPVTPSAEVPPVLPPAAADAPAVAVEPPAAAAEAANVGDGGSVAVDASAGVQPPLTVDGPRAYASLYDSQGTTVAAILFGVLIVGGIQWVVARMYQSAKSEQEYLTRFVTALVALVMGAYIADLLIAGPDTSLLSPEEHLTILGFVKDVCLMVFAYFFGTKSSGGSAPPATDIPTE